MTENDLIQQITDVAHDVFRTLGSGHSEIAYQKAMEVGLRLRHLKFEAQKVVELSYCDHYIGVENLDILVEANARKVIVELKAAQQDLGPPEEQQLRNYMKCLGIEHGVLINFPQPGRTKKEAELGIRALDPDIRLVALAPSSADLLAV